MIKLYMMHFAIKYLITIINDIQILDGTCNTLFTIINYKDRYIHNRRCTKVWHFGKDLD